MGFVIQSPLTPACRNAALRRAGTIGSQRQVFLCDLCVSAVRILFLKYANKGGKGMDSIITNYLSKLEFKEMQVFKNAEEGPETGRMSSLSQRRRNRM
jgi:hypothetical protein